MLFNGVGLLTSALQEVVSAYLRKKNDLSLYNVFLKICLFATGIIHLDIQNNFHIVTDLSDKCKQVIDMTDSQIAQMDHGFTLMKDHKELINYKHNASLVVLLYTIVFLQMLEKTEGLGNLILMTKFVAFELARFFLTFGSFIGLFLILYWTLQDDIRLEPMTLGHLAQDLISTINGHVDYSNYKVYFGSIYIATSTYILCIIFMSILVAIFTNRYAQLWHNIDAIRRMDIINMKNKLDYDRFFGAITMTFFPINIVALPVIPFIVFFKSERLNEMMLKIQYSILISMYITIGLLLTVPAIPILYGKCLCNQIYITFILQHNKKGHLLL